MKAITIFVFRTVLLGGPTAQNSALAARGKVIGILKRGMKKAVDFAFPMRVRGWRTLTITNDRTSKTLTQTPRGQTLKWSPPGSSRDYLTTMPKQGQAFEQVVYKNDGLPGASRPAQPLLNNDYKYRSPLGAYGKMLYNSRLVRGAFWTSVFAAGVYCAGEVAANLQRLANAF